MLLNKIGEFGLIERFRASLRADASVILGSGDDCAVLKFSRDKYQLFTCDMLVEGVDFTSQDDPYLIGKKAIGVSVSDIASCAGLPTSCLVALGLPARSTLEFSDKLFQGMLDTARQYKINIVGGDLSRSAKLVIDVSMLGLVEKKYLALRSAAKAGDIIFVTGTLGMSISGKHLRFTPRLKEARYLVEHFRINAMIDISDGLAQDLSHILKASNKGALIYESLIPLSQEARSSRDALYGGEEFELLFTMPPKEAGKFSGQDLKVFKPIGEITDKLRGLRLIDKKNKAKIIQAKGFRHF